MKIYKIIYKKKITSANFFNYYSFKELLGGNSTSKTITRLPCDILSPKKGIPKPLTIFLAPSCIISPGVVAI
jgi:hypothetical protein